MKLKLILLTVLNLLIGLPTITAQADNYDAAPINFEKTLQTAKPTSFWWWLNSLADKGSITSDLEAFKAKGMGGVTLICSGNWGASDLPSGAGLLSSVNLVTITKLVRFFFTS